MNQSLGHYDGGAEVQILSHDVFGHFIGLVESTERTLNLDLIGIENQKKISLEINESLVKLVSEGKSIKPDQSHVIWKGIPVELAPPLFSGQIPCPSDRRIKQSTLSWDDETDALIVQEADSTRFEFRLEIEGEKFQPISVLWTRMDPTDMEAERFFWSEISFQDLESNAKFPNYWKARSDSGQVVVRRN